ncbi:hypothetical protein RP75_11125 [Agrobacterium arsenijevicii]|uniref:Uncharacterized protein n=1 Tax=Agrobacterium arsenijevicii TaxID=1585697 RepID=A0ABR5D8I1_9HYPH|nr:hypothetical protein RP75_11125 [Agrobacterium arsenijevicii]
MAFAQQADADIVRAIHQLDIFLARIQAGCDTIVIFDEAGRVSLPDIGQHAEKVMGAKADRHRARFR